MKRLAMGGLGLALILVLAAPAPAARGPQVKTTVVIERITGATRAVPARRAVTTWAVLGTVEASKRKCEVRRKVNVFYKDTGKKVGFTFSDSGGYFALRIESSDYASGTYFAKAPKLKLRKGFCKPDRSPDAEAV